MTFSFSDFLRGTRILVEFPLNLLNMETNNSYCVFTSKKIALGRKEVGTKIEGGARVDKELKSTVDREEEAVALKVVVRENITFS